MMQGSARKVSSRFPEKRQTSKLQLADDFEVWIAAVVRLTKPVNAEICVNEAKNGS